MRLRLMRTSGVVALFAAALMGIGAAIGGQDPLRPLAPLLARGGATPVGVGPDFAHITDEASLTAALGAGDAQPTLIYVTADWCVTCRGIERNVLPDAAVTTALTDMRLLKADVTNLDAGGRALLQSLGAAGPPTMVFLDAMQREAAESRLIGTISARDIVTSSGLVRIGGG